VRATFGLLAAVTGGFNPRLNYLYGIDNIDSYQTHLQTYYNSALYIAIPTFLGILILAPQIIYILFGSEFLPGIITLRILAPLIVVFSLATVLGHVCLIIYHKERLLLLATIIGAVVNFSLNLILIPHLYHNGVAIASVICEVLVTILLILFSMKVVKICLINRLVLISLFSGVMMAGIIALLGLYIKDITIYTIVAIIAGAVIYYLTSSVLGHDISVYLKTKILNFVKFNNQRA
jgi:O-antigen/teichoic acid export membrane protein